jgi:hypothetical protein
MNAARGQRMTTDARMKTTRGALGRGGATRRVELSRIGAVADDRVAT